MIELHKNGVDWWIDGHIYTPHQFAFYLQNKEEQDGYAFQERETELAALKIRITEAEKICQKFVAKVESGRARSKETYAECKTFLSPSTPNQE